MKTLYESLLDDFEDLSSSLSPKVIKEKIKQFLKDNYKNPSKFKISRKPNDDGLYEVTCTGKQIQLDVSAKTLTNGLFKFADFDGTFHCNQNFFITSLEGAPEKISGHFICKLCSNLTSLEGAPKEVGGGFECSFCGKLKTLTGAPKEVGGYFDCSDCSNLISLEGSPEKVHSMFRCSCCRSLTSLKGAPKKVERFFCHNCSSLKSLEGAPEYVAEEFSCYNCGKQFTDSEVLKYTKVKRVDLIYNE